MQLIFNLLGIVYDNKKEIKKKINCIKVKPIDPDKAEKFMHEIKKAFGGY